MKHSKSEVLLAVLIDIPPEDAAVVLTFEDAVLPLLNRHGGQLQRRLRAVDRAQNSRSSLSTPAKRRRPLPRTRPACS